MELIISKAAAKVLNRMPPKHRQTMVDHLRAIAADPTTERPQTTGLVGADKAYRLRVADWRAIYRVTDTSVIADVIGPRGGIYR